MTLQEGHLQSLLGDLSKTKRKKIKENNIYSFKFRKQTYHSTPPPLSNRHLLILITLITTMIATFL